MPRLTRLTECSFGGVVSLRPATVVTQQNDIAPVAMAWSHRHAILERAWIDSRDAQRRLAGESTRNRTKVRVTATNRGPPRRDCPFNPVESTDRHREHGQTYLSTGGDQLTAQSG